MICIIAILQPQWKWVKIGGTDDLSNNSNSNSTIFDDNYQNNQTPSNNINYELTEADKAKMRKQKLILYTVVSVYLIFIAVSVIKKKLRK